MRRRTEGARQVGFYYWRGRVLPLLVLPSGESVVKVPAWLADVWKKDVRLGRVSIN